MNARTHLAIFILCVLLVVIFTLPLATNPAHLLPKHWDPGVFSWVMASNSHRIVREPLELFQGNVMYPHGSAISYSEPLLTPTLTYAPVFWWTGNPILAYNLTLIIFWALSGVAMAWLAHRVTGNLAAALLGGLVFMLCPYRIEYYLEFQMHLSFALPLAVWGWYRFLVKPDWTPLALAVGAIVATFYATIYYALILSLALVALTIVYAAMRWSGWRLRAIGRAAVGAVAGLGLVGPLLIPYLRTRSELGFERVLSDEPLFHSADLLTYLETRQTWLYQLTRTDAETVLFMGSVPTALALLGIWWLLWKPRHQRLAGSAGRWAGWLTIGGAAAFAPAVLVARRFGDENANALPWLPVAALVVILFGGVMWFLARGRERIAQGRVERELDAGEWAAVALFLAFVFFAISLGPWIRLDGEIVGPGLYPAFHATLPFLRAIRVITRFGVIFTLAMSLLAAIGASELLRRSGRLRPVAIAIGLLIVVELYSGTLEYGSVQWPPASPAYARVAEAQPAALLEVPFDAYLLDADEMLRSTHHWAYLMNGVSGFVPEFSIGLAHRLRHEGLAEFPTPATRQLLRSVYPLRFILVHRDQLPEQELLKWENFDRKMPGVRLVDRYGSDDLYEVDPAAEESALIERRFSFDFISRRPVASFRVSATGPDVDKVEAWLQIRFNGDDLDRLPLMLQASAYDRLLPTPFRRSAANLLEFDFGYRFAAPADASYELGRTGLALPLNVRLMALGTGGGASAEVNGEQQLLLEPGYHVLVLDPTSGGILGREHFATDVSPRANRLLNRHLRQLEDGAAVALVGLGDAGRHLDDATVRAIRRLGGAVDLRERPRTTHLLIGIKGTDQGALELADVGDLMLLHGGDPSRVRLRLEHFAMQAPQR